MAELKKPKGEVRFAYGEFSELPFNAEEVTLYMVPGESVIYFVPNSTIPVSYIKTISNFDSEIQLEN